MKYKYFKQGMQDGIPIALGYFAVSFTFGMAAVTGGLTVWDAVLISMTNLTSAGQFAGLGIILAAGSYWEMAMTQLIINLRYSLMSFSLSQKLEKGINPLHRFVVAFGMTDEIFAVSASQPGKVSPYYNYGAMSVAIPGWILGTLAGAILGNVLPGSVTNALSVAIYGMFLAIIIPPAKKDSAVMKVVIAAMVVSMLFAVLPVLNQVSGGFVIIITTVLIAGLAAYFFPIKEQEVTNHGA
jgi:predicted branched-subunit amino acid permease